MKWEINLALLKINTVCRNKLGSSSVLAFRRVAVPSFTEALGCCGACVAGRLRMGKVLIVKNITHYKSRSDTVMVNLIFACFWVVWCLEEVKIFRSIDSIGNQFPQPFPWVSLVFSISTSAPKVLLKYQNMALPNENLNTPMQKSSNHRITE